MIDRPRPRFALGRTVATPAALAALENAGQQAIEFLWRHHLGDWGTVDDEDRQANEDALQHGGRLMSVYETKQGTPLWIITEADRSATTVLLPEDY